MAGKDVSTELVKSLADELSEYGREEFAKALCELGFPISRIQEALCAENAESHRPWAGTYTGEGTTKEAAMARVRRDILANLSNARNTKCHRLTCGDGKECEIGMKESEFTQKLQPFVECSFFIREETKLWWKCKLTVPEANRPNVETICDCVPEEL